MMNIAGGFIFTFFLSIVRISGDCSQGFPRLTLSFLHNADNTIHSSGYTTAGEDLFEQVVVL